MYNEGLQVMDDVQEIDPFIRELASLQTGSLGHPLKGTKEEILSQLKEAHANSKRKSYNQVDINGK